MPADKLHIFYSDDQERFREEFLTRHRDRFEIDDEQMRRIESAEVDWLLKDSDRFSATTEDVRIRRVVERSKASKQMPRDVRIAIWSVTAGIIGSVLTLAIQALVT